MLIAFDLDDTLVPEMDFVRSAYREIARRHGWHMLPAMMTARTPAEAFDSTGLPIGEALEIYRTHTPDIRLPWQSLYTLESLRLQGHTLALVTDGRSVTQRHKIEALGLSRWIRPDDIYISEEWGSGKADGSALADLMRRHPGETQCVYVGDNPEKDIEAPRRLGWKTVILLDKGDNIHPQRFDGFSPDAVVHSLTELTMLEC